MSQGANPWSDLGCSEALRVLGRNLERAVRDASDSEAREQMMWAATLAGIAFGNAGVHAPHGMAYAVAGLVRDFHPAGYPSDEPLVPHGMSVIVNAPAVFRFTGRGQPAAAHRGGPTARRRHRDAGPDDAGEVLATEIIRIMRAVGMPNGLSGVGYTDDDITALTEGALPPAASVAERPAGDEQADSGRVVSATPCATGRPLGADEVRDGTWPPSGANRRASRPSWRRRARACALASVGLPRSACSLSSNTGSLPTSEPR